MPLIKSIKVLVSVGLAPYVILQNDKIKAHPETSLSTCLKLRLNAKSMPTMVYGKVLTKCHGSITLNFHATYVAYKAWYLMIIPLKLVGHSYNRQ